MHTKNVLKCRIKHYKSPLVSDCVELWPLGKAQVLSLSNNGIHFLPQAQVPQMKMEFQPSGCGWLHRRDLFTGCSQMYGLGLDSGLEGGGREGEGGGTWLKLCCSSCPVQVLIEWGLLGLSLPAIRLCVLCVCVLQVSSTRPPTSCWTASESSCSYGESTQHAICYWKIFFREGIFFPRQW